MKKNSGAFAWLRENRVAQLLLAIALIYLFLQWQKMGEIGGFFWLSRPHSDEIYFADYPKLISSPSQFSVYSSEALACSLCGREVQLSKGNNELGFSASECNGTVRLDCGEKSLHFSYEAAQNLSAEAVSLSAVPSLENRQLVLRISGIGTANGFHQLQILIGGKVVASPLHMLSGTFFFTESVPAPNGEHKYKVMYNGEILSSGEFSQTPMFSLSTLLTLLLCAGLAIVWRGSPANRLLGFIPLLAACLVIEFRLEQASAGFIVPAILAGFLYHYYFTTRRMKRNDLAFAEERKLAKEALIAGAAFAAFILLTNIFISTYDIWGAYYFRHVQYTFEQGTTDYWDALSYLGRQSTYPPIFFEFAAQVARSFGFIVQSYEDIRVPLNLLLSVAYGASAYLVFRRFQFNQRVLAAALYITLWGTLMNGAGIGLHMLAFTLMNCAVALLPSSLLLSAVSLGLAFAAHPLALAFFPFLALSANGFKLDRKVLILATAAAIAAVIISLPFYLPILARAGLPYEIVPDTWGYLLNYGIDGIRFGLNFLLPLSLAAVASAFYRRSSILPATLLLLLALATAFVSLRLDVAFAIVIAGFVPLAFAKELQDRRFLLLLLLAYILPNLALGAVVMNGTSYFCAWGLSNDVCVSPMKYLNAHSPSESTVALNPLYGHLEAYLGKRPVLADLYVEYADQAKWEAENNFYVNSSLAPIASYGIDYAVLDDNGMQRSVPADRVYDNGYMHAFRLR